MMRRFVAILMVAVLSLTAVRPTLATHFCRGEFRSLGLAGEELLAGCCGGMMEEAPAEGLVVSAPVEPCCTRHAAHLATDDFHAGDGGATVAAWEVAWVAMGWREERVCRDFFFLSLVRQFPPGRGGLPPLDVRALTCVART